ncbi:MULTISPECIES: MMPL family transporter [unclassified Pseudonocardia]|uniref:MMPL family transporter n=1 Tax=unclassified Pseudonocardia TaxID=2619320 RepID=UPI0001FFE4B4|nr:MMPL family transporter [Pseudonocardia sp. Ae707_Ps1]OLM16738.1 protein export membrane protein [Pseudonocardia sp. Ae707_Ps1]
MRRRLLAALVATLVVAVTLGGLLQLRVDTGIGSFLPAGDPALAAIEDKAAGFGGDPIVVLLETEEPRRLLEDPDQLKRLLGLEGRLASSPDVAAVYGPGTVLNQIAGGAQNLLAQLAGSRDTLRNAGEQDAREQGLGQEAVASAGRAATAEFDRRYGSLLVGGLPAGLPTLNNPRFVDAVLFDDGAPRPQWQVIVPGPERVAILVRPRAELDQTGTAAVVRATRDAIAESGLQTSRVTVSGVPAVTAALTEQATREAPLLGAASVLAVAGLFLAVPWTRARRSRLRPLGAALIGTALTLAAFGWTGNPVSLGVVAFLPILIGIGSDFPLYLSQPAHRRRVLVAALAGAAGFGSLALSPLPFVRELGVALAVGVLATVGVALLGRHWLAETEPAVAVVLEPVPVPHRWRWVVAGLAVVLSTLGWAALPGLDVEARPEQLARGLPALEDARYTEEVLGSSGELSIVLRGDDVLTPEAVEWSRRAETVVVERFGGDLRPVTTFSTLLQFLGDRPTPQQVLAGARLLPDYLRSAVLRPDQREALLVFGVDLQDPGEQARVLDGVRAALPPPPPGYSAELAGLPVAAVSGYDALSSSRILLNLVGIAAAGLVLLLGLRARADAGRALLTVLLASGWVLGVAWWTAGSLSPLTVAIGSLTTATGCEFAVMLCDAHRRREPWLLRSVGLAAAAAALGYLTLVVSDLAVLRQFGLLLAASVFLSAVAAAVVVRVVWPPGALAATRDPAPRRSERAEAIR